MARKEIVEILRQRSRPYLFSNSLAPSVVWASIAVIDMISQSTTLRDKLWDNTKIFSQANGQNSQFDMKPSNILLSR